MERKLATIEKILDVQPIAGADAIECATVRGWQCVIKKGEFKVGDLCVYCEIDSFLPIRSEFEFLRKSCYRKLEDGSEGFRIKTAKLRGQISQGICFSLSILESAGWKFDYTAEGMDVTSILGIKKYEVPIPACLSGVMKGILPAFIKKTDEERIQNIPFIFEKYAGRSLYGTEKLDGSSATYYYRDGEFGVCSHNIDLMESDTNTFWKIAHQLDLKAKLAHFGRNLALQGELIGEGIQKNIYKIKGHTIRFFSIFDIDAYRYVTLKELEEILRTLQLEMVPIVYHNIVLQPTNTVNDFLQMAQGVSVLNSRVPREGVVFRTQNGEIVPASEIPTGHLSFKVISNDFLLKEKE